MVNKFKMKDSIITYNLGGMGCSAGIIAIDLAKDLLKVISVLMTCQIRCIPIV